MTAPAKDDCKDCYGTGNEIQAQPAAFWTADKANAALSNLQGHRQKA
jgi:hypothetical protein